MAERRMFAKTIIDSDAFLEMPLSTQALYFHLAMRADDEGFINNPRKIQRMIGSSDDDLKLLCAKHFIIPFESGVVVIKHWRIHNYIRSDRFKPTVYEDERAQLAMKDNGSYTVAGMTVGIPNGYQVDTQYRIGKDSTVKDSKEVAAKRFVPPSVDDVKAYCKEKNITNVDADQFVDYYQSNGWRVGGKSAMKDWRAAIRNWSRNGYGKVKKDNNKFNNFEQREYDFDDLEQKLMNKLHEKGGSDDVRGS